jgi:hypothetical protein
MRLSQDRLSIFDSDKDSNEEKKKDPKVETGLFSLAKTTIKKARDGANEFKDY